MTAQLPSPPPRWQPISQLPTVVVLVDYLRELVAEHYAMLNLIRQQPYTLDAATVERAVALYKEPRQQALMGRYAEQARRWEARARTPEQRRAVEQLIGSLERLRAEIAAVLTLADDMQGERYQAADVR